MTQLEISKGLRMGGWKIWALISAFVFTLVSHSLIAGELICPPDGTNAFFQTNGPNAEFNWGDWWTNSNEDGGSQPHMFEIYVPESVSSSFTMEIELYDPECYQTGSEVDELEGVGVPPAWDMTEFKLYAPDGSTKIAHGKYIPVATTSEKWNAFASVPISQYGTGVYKLYVNTEFDDQNSYKIKIVNNDPDNTPKSGDEINLAPVETSYQHNTTGCTTFWFFVPKKPELRLSNFDMDETTSVTYTDPSGNIISGTVSGSTVWNNEGRAWFPPPGGDVVENPESGWWQAELCIEEGNQYVFYPEGAIWFENPPDYPEIAITKDDGLTQIVVDNETTYDIIIENIGTGPALNTVITDTLPANVNYVSASGSPTVTSYSGTSILTWNIGQLASGTDSTVQVTVRVSASTVENVINDAWVSYKDVMYNEYSGIYNSDEDILIAPASIGDLVWFDEDGSSAVNGSEVGLENVIIYLKNANGDTIFTQTTASDGSYEFSSVMPGTYTVDIDGSTVSANYISSTNNDPLSVTVASGDSYTTADFGYKQGPDTDGDGVPDHIEGGGDRDGDGVPDYEDYDPTGYIYDESTGEILTGGLVQASGPGVVTFVENGSAGYYEFYTDGTPGTYTIQVTAPPGYLISSTCTSSDPPPYDPTGQSNPVVLGNGENASTGYLTSTDCTPYYYTFNLEEGDPYVFNNNFPMQFSGLDFGDAPDPTYSTLLVNNGARHTIVAGYYLGSSVDADVDGQITGNGLGDDLDGNDDDDGVTFNGALVQSSNNTIQVVASGLGYLNAWIDLNDDGDWLDTGEHVIQDRALTAGTNNITFWMPLITTEGSVRTEGRMGRFRFSSATGLNYAGLAVDGEVEDYLIDTLIPVELTGFEVVGQKGIAQISWQTQSESNNLGFHIYRSEKKDGEYVRITDDPINGAGSSESMHSYSFTDNTAEPGKTYFYKLADVSYNGSITMHEAREVTIELPQEYSLHQNYPNPFNPETLITFSLKESGLVNLNIYNMNGQLVRSLVSENRNSGQFDVVWNGRNDLGMQVPSGIYMYRIQINDYSQTKRMVLMK